MDLNTAGMVLGFARVIATGLLLITLCVGFIYGLITGKEGISEGSLMVALGFGLKWLFDLPDDVRTAKMKDKGMIDGNDKP